MDVITMLSWKKRRAEVIKQDMREPFKKISSEICTGISGMEYILNREKDHI